jgi:hypothetical protein
VRSNRVSPRGLVDGLGEDGGGPTAKETTDTFSATGTTGRRPCRGRTAAATGGVLLREEDEVEDDVPELHLLRRRCHSSFIPVCGAADGGSTRWRAQGSSDDFLSDRKRDSFVRFWHRGEGIRCVGEKGEKKEDLTRNRSNTLGKPEELGGGRKTRRNVAVGDDVGDELDDSLIDSLRACVEEVQRRTAELWMASAWRAVAGNDGTTANWAPVFD